MMDCQQVRECLLGADDLLAEQSAGVTAHLRDCPACRQVAGQLVRLEDAWRAMPPPVEAEPAKRAFLARLAATSTTRGISPRRLSRRSVLQLCSASAASLLAIGGGGWLFFSSQRAQADDNLLDRLVDWNLQISQAQSPVERADLYNEQADRFRAMISGTHLSAEDADFAKECFDNAAWLVSNNDPVVVADRFSGMADRLLQRAISTDGARNSKKLNHLLQQYNHVLESGVGARIELAEASGALDFEHQKKLEQIILRDPQRMQMLADLLERSPNASRKEIAQALKTYARRQKKSKSGKAGGNSEKTTIGQSTGKK